MSSSSSSISKASFVSALLIALTSVAHAGDLTVEVKGLKSATGWQDAAKSR